MLVVWNKVCLLVVRIWHDVIRNMTTVWPRVIFLGRGRGERGGGRKRGRKGGMERIREKRKLEGNT